MGGNAFDIVNKIEQKNINPTLKKEIEPLLKKLGIKKYKLLGSALKKDEPSGDLDIGIEWNEVLNILGIENKKFSKDIVLSLFENAGIKDINLRFFGAMATMCIPIIGQDGEFVQTDLMFFDNLDYGELAKFAPEKGTSKYKSVIKNFLFYAIFPSLRFDMKYIDNELIGYKQFMVNDTGLFIKEVSRINNKNKILKNFKVLNREFITNNWNEIWNKIMGPDFKKEDWNSFESLYKYISGDVFIYRDKLSEIVSNFNNTLDKNNLGELKI